MLKKLVEFLKGKESEKPYHVHALEGYSKHTYRYVGNYKTEKRAWWAVKVFCWDHPYGMATVTTSPDEPEYIND